MFLFRNTYFSAFVSVKFSSVFEDYVGWFVIAATLPNTPESIFPLFMFG